MSKDINKDIQAFNLSACEQYNVQLMYKNHPLAKKIKKDLDHAYQAIGMYLLQGCDVGTVNCGGITIKADYKDYKEEM